MRRRVVGPRWPAPGAHGGDGVGERAAGAVPLTGLLEQADLDELAHVGRDVGGQRRRLLLDVLHRDGQRAVADERAAARDGLVADDAERVDVAGGGGVPAERLLRGDVLRGAHHHAGLRHRRGVDGLGDAEVGELHLTGRGDQDVARLHVAVHEARGVRDLQRPPGLLEHVEGVPQRQPPGALEHGVQRFAGDHLHHQVGGATGVVEFGLAVVVDAGDAGVVQHGDGARLGAEPLDELGVRRELRLEHLDGDLAAEAGVRRLPDLAHAARGDESLKTVAVGQRHSDARAHDPSRSAAAMVARPIGAASAPPVAANRSPPFSTRTAMATFGCLRRGEGDVPGVGRGVARVGAVFGRARLGSDLDARDGTRLLGHLLGVDHQVRKCSGDLQGHRPAQFPWARRADVGKVGSLQVLDQIRLHRHPAVGDGRGDHRVLQRGERDVLLADARHAEGGVVADRADGRRPTCSGIGAGAPSRPNASAVLRSASAPVLMPSSTNAVLHDFANAVRNVAVGSLPHDEPP